MSATIVEGISEETVKSLRAAFQSDLAAAAERLIAETGAQAHTAIESIRAAGRVELEGVLTDLRDKTRQNVELTDSVLQLQIEIEELQAKLAAEHERAQAVDRERDQVIGAYESQLQALKAELDAERAAFNALKQQLDVEAADRARLVAALKTVQQACSVADATFSANGSRAGEHDELDITTELDTEAAASTPDDHSSGQTARKLTLVQSAPPSTAADAPPELVEYVKQLFDQIDATYWVDHQAHASVEVVDRLCANLRYAQDVFRRRVSSEEGTAINLFEEELTTRIDAHGSTSLGRHLAIAAYELRGEGSVRAEAS